MQQSPYKRNKISQLDNTENIFTSIVIVVEEGEMKESKILKSVLKREPRKYIGRRCKSDYTLEIHGRC